MSRSLESSFENMNNNIHSAKDTMDHPEFSFNHMRECVNHDSYFCMHVGLMNRRFSKLAVAFVVELGGFE